MELECLFRLVMCFAKASHQFNSLLEALKAYPGRVRGVREVGAIVFIVKKTGNSATAKSSILCPWLPRA